MTEPGETEPRAHQPALAPRGQLEPADTAPGSPGEPATLVADEAQSAHAVQRRWPLVSGVVALALVAAAAALIALRKYSVVPYPIDAGWMKFLMSHRTPALENIALVFDALGGGLVAILVVPLAGAALLWWRRGRWSAIYFILALAISAGLVQLIKGLVGRPRPPEILITADFGSFPSGHSANAATLAVAVGIIVWRVWVWVVGAAYTLAMMLSRNYLGAHWLTDTVGGMILGAGVAILCWAPFALSLYAERHPRTHRPVAPLSAGAGPTEPISTEPVSTEPGAIAAGPSGDRRAEGPSTEAGAPRPSPARPADPGSS